MTSTVERRKHFADVVNMGRDDLLRFAAYRSLENEWNTAISEWRAEEEHAATSKAAEEMEVRRLDDQRRSLRARRQSELLLADDLLQQTHKELDSLLMSAGSCVKAAAGNETRRSSGQSNSAGLTTSISSSHTESLLHSTPAPTEVDAFDDRLPRLVPPSYHSKAQAMLQQLQGASAAVDGEVSLKTRANAAVVSPDASMQPRHGASSTTAVGVLLSSQSRDAVALVLQELSELIDTLAAHHWNPVLLHCRAACHYALGNMRLALKDSAKALDLCHDDYHVSLRTLAYRRILRCHIVLVDGPAALEVIAQCKASCTSSFGSTILDSLAHEQSLVTSLHHLRESCEHKLWSQALVIASKLCNEVPEAPALAEKRIEILVNTATSDNEGSKTLNDIASATLKFPSCGGIWYWYGVQQLKHSNNFQDVEAASRSLQRAVSLAGIEGNAAAKQELQKVRYLESKAAMATAYHKSKRWRQAVAELTMLLTLSGVSKGLKRLFTSMRAKAFLALGRPTECLSDATYLLNHALTDEQVVDAYVLRAEAHVVGRNREAALRDARCASGVLPGHAIAAALLRQLESDDNHNDTAHRPPTPPPQRASSSSRFVPPEATSPPGGHMPSPPPRGRQEANAARSAPAVAIPAHYVSLNVAVTATSAVITKSYREAALRWHPDRWTSGSAHEVQLAEEVFKKLNTAYHTLTDDALRVAYDREHGIRR
jgi:hypothetical protein